MRQYDHAAIDNNVNVSRIFAYNIKMCLCVFAGITYNKRLI